MKGLRFHRGVPGLSENCGGSSRRFGHADCIERGGVGLEVALRFFPADSFMTVLAVYPGLMPKVRGRDFRFGERLIKNGYAKPGSPKAPKNVGLRMVELRVRGNDDFGRE